MEAESRTVRFEPIRSANVVAKAIEHYEAGHSVLVICNTVKRCREAYNAIKLAIKDPADTMILHARIVADSRGAREAEIVRRFGRDGEKGPFILVATQVVEQSMDIDFDVGISDMAPGDLLLQRAGRIQRHRPENEQLLYVATDSADKVYEQLIIDITRSAIASERFGTVHVPEDVQAFVDECYPDTSRPAAPPSTWTGNNAAYKTEFNNLTAKINRNRSDASVALVQSTFENDDKRYVSDGKDVPDPIAEELTDAPTRLGASSYRAVVSTQPQPGKVKDPARRSLTMPSFMTDAITAALTNGQLETYDKVDPTKRRFANHIAIGTGIAQIGKFTITYSEELGLVEL